MTDLIRDRRVYWGATAAALALAAALGYHAVYGQHGYRAYRSEQRRYLELQQKTLDLKRQNQALQEEIDALNRHDPAVIEDKARGQQYARPGEKIYTYTPPASHGNGAGTSETSTPSDSGSQR
ncbi:MAG TPA: septum formation initiator family protein [Terriglobia bacterium]|jgi:cell division protein FtsB|nr:septum formation initiator family protein [Terriglobia bacterium]